MSPVLHFVDTSTFYILHICLIFQWLIVEALPSNPKLNEIEGRWMFQPPLPARDRKSLLKLLQKHDMKGLGGVLLDDIQESIPHCDKVMKVSFYSFIFYLRTDSFKSCKHAPKRGGYRSKY